MRQSDGIDLLGTNDPRSADIGIIYVAPDDDRQSVLAAILTQDKLGRKQVVVVLPEQNKAFLRPVDFDGLKNMRRGLQTQLVFVAPQGSGPSEFARQRRFPVYSSLEDYAQTFRNEDPSQDTTKNPGLFGRRRKPVATNVTPLSFPGVVENEESQTHPPVPVTSLEGNAPGTDRETDGGHSHLDENDDDNVVEFPIPAPVPQEDESAVSRNVHVEMDRGLVSSNPGSAEDNVVESDSMAFPSSRGRTTGNLPVPVPIVMSVPSVPSVQPGAIPVDQRVGHPAIYSPPPRMAQRRWPIIALIVLVLLLLGYIGYMALAPLLAVPTATVTITPTSKDLKNTYTISAVTGIPNSSQVAARILSSSTSAQLKTVNASGTGHIAAVQSLGSLTFFNASPNQQTVMAGTVFTDARGVKVVNDQTVIIPAANPPAENQVTVSAHAINAGASGNIPAFDFNNVPCCANGVFVQNDTAFGGGQDGQNFTYVEQSDIDGAANAIAASQAQAAQVTLQKQIHPNEQLISPAQCTPAVSADHRAGDQATSITLSVAVSCLGEVYDRQAAQLMAEGLLKTDPTLNPGSSYALVGNIVTTMMQATADAKGNVSLLVRAQGVWVYQFSGGQKRELVKLVAGKNQRDAQTLLLQQTGLSKANIQLSGGDGKTLPTDLSQITVVVVSVTGI